MAKKVEHPLKYVGFIKLRYVWQSQKLLQDHGRFEDYPMMHGNWLGHKFRFALRGDKVVGFICLDTKLGDNCSYVDPNEKKPQEILTTLKDALQKTSMI